MMEEGRAVAADGIRKRKSGASLCLHTACAARLAVLFIATNMAPVTALDGGVPRPQFSFHWPDEPEHSTCCPNIQMPGNMSAGLQLPSLVGIGVEKCGSTYLASLLKMHPELQIARRKEVHFLDNSFPEVQLPSVFSAYLKMWNANKHKAQGSRGLRGYDEEMGGFDVYETYSETQEDQPNDWMDEQALPAHDQPHLQLYEVTPNYIYIPSAACRAKALLPNTKFVAVLRDPADRAYSQFTMFRSLQCPKYMRASKPFICPYQWLRFYDVVQEGIALLGVRNCTFNTGSPVRSWNDCFGCLINDHTVTEYCHGRWYLFNDGPTKQRCHDFASDIISRGLYAAQIAWWFQQFPPEQFLFISSDDLFEDPVRELNRVADFIGLEAPFTSNMLETAQKVYQNKGKYRKFHDTLVEESKAILREFYSQPNEDLYELLRINGHYFRRFDEGRGSTSGAQLEDIVDVLM
ncbi:unnamed protein product [Ostreobium quekettii]|uniref:Sulfotransferase n=1 Tax=Ostreobium quekettii TaxID=121088 RepID=A0A8S1IW49_9CHLO|nr:unnamed protein product [Ostreobium quekettii]|eukprot:evm.model.scf_1040.2 EVM.evm.TU.scf_1040.2   scf_1040:12758-19091(+)